MPELNIKYGTLDGSINEHAKTGDIIFAKNDVSSEIYIGIADGQAIKFGGNYDEFVNLLQRIDPMLGLDSSNGTLKFDSSTSYITDVNNVADALVMLDKAIKENGDNDEITSAIDSSTIESLFNIED